MKRLLLFLVMLSVIASYSQSKTKKYNCYCPPKKVVHKKHIIKKKVLPKKPCEVVVNNTIVCPPEKIIETKVIETKVIEKEVIVKYIEEPVSIIKEKGPILELYTGYVEAKDNNLKFSALIGGNLYLDLFQGERQGKHQRKYANRMLLGFEHSALISKNVNITIVSPEKPKDVENCNCTNSSLGLNGGTETNVFKHKVRAVSLNAGIEVYKGWYLLTGITNYQHILTLNNEEYNEYRTLYIDAGIQKVIKVNRWFFIPKFKFNPETFTFGVGVSYQ